MATLENPAHGRVFRSRLPHAGVPPIFLFRASDLRVVRRTRTMRPKPPRVATFGWAGGAVERGRTT